MSTTYEQFKMKTSCELFLDVVSTVAGVVIAVLYIQYYDEYSYGGTEDYPPKTPYTNQICTLSGGLI